MSFPTERKLELNKVHAELMKVQGLAIYEEDDFDSRSINLFLSLQVKDMRGNKAFAFKRRICDIKRAIRCAIERVGKEFNFLHWPQIQYEYDNGERTKLGYDCYHIKLEVFV